MKTDDNEQYNKGERSGGKITNEYIYEDEQGRPYLKVGRTEFKKFPCWLYAKGGALKKDKWVKSDSGKIKKHYPYMLPNLVKLGKEVPVFICEGEKDAETVIDLGLEATTNAGGAYNWTEDLNKWFKGRKVVYILEDRDVHGRRRSQKIVRGLRKLVEDIRVVALPEVPKNEDVSWWVRHQNGTKDKLLQLAADSSREKANKIEIEIQDGHIAEEVDKTEKALFYNKCPIFQRAGFLVEPIWTEMLTTSGRKTKTTVLRRLNIASLDYIINKHAVTYRRFDKRANDYVEINPPTKITERLLEKQHWLFPKVVGVINTPTLRPDGSLIVTPGYDPATQLWYEAEKNFAMPSIPSKPTKENAIAALEKFKQLLIEFPFDTEVDRSVAIAAILTAVLRGSFMLAPMFLFQAHTAGTGKSYLANLISHIVRGRPCPVTTFDDKEEMKKKLGAMILESVPMFSIDNCSDNVGGDLLCQITEQPIVKIRVLGKMETPECEWRGIVFATGNNISVYGDMTRRTLISTLDAKMERPETREFKYHPIDIVMLDRSAYVAAAIIIAQAYLNSKRIKCEPLASYEEWSKTAREPLIWLGEADPVDSLNKAREEDPERNSAEALFALWGTKDLKLGQGYKTVDIISAVNKTHQPEVWDGRSDWEYDYPELHELILERAPTANGRSIDGKRLGRWLASLRGQVHDGRRLDLGAKSRAHGHSWVISEHKKR